MSGRDEAKPGSVVTLAEGVRRVTATNGGRLTASGTNSFIVGQGDVVVIDPGPDEAAHLERILAATRSERIVGIALTHGHSDHAGLVPALIEASGAEILGDDAVAGFGVETIPTPGHTSDHVAFRVGDMLLTGDHVFETTSTMIDWPDGTVSRFLETCRRLKELDQLEFHPAHGPNLQAPSERLDWLIAHREARNAAILGCLATRPLPVLDLLTKVYGDLPASLHDAARRTLLAHLAHLEELGAVARENGTETPRYVAM